jgi:hypothetical protein
VLESQTSTRLGGSFGSVVPSWSLRALRAFVKPRNWTLRSISCGWFARHASYFTFGYAMAAGRGDGVVVGGGMWCCFVYRCIILACFRNSVFVSNDAFLCHFTYKFPIAMTL